MAQQTLAQQQQANAYLAIAIISGGIVMVVILLFLFSGTSGKKKRSRPPPLSWGPVAPVYEGPKQMYGPNLPKRQPVSYGRLPPDPIYSQLPGEQKIGSRALYEGYGARADDKRNTPESAEMYKTFLRKRLDDHDMADYLRKKQGKYVPPPEATYSEQTIASSQYQFRNKQEIDALEKARANNPPQKYDPYR